MKPAILHPVTCAGFVACCVGLLLSWPAFAFPAPETISTLAPSMAALWAALTGAAGAGVALRNTRLLPWLALSILVIIGLLWQAETDRQRLMDYSLQRVYPLAAPTAPALSLAQQEQRPDGVTFETLIAEADAGQRPVVIWPEYSAERDSDRLFGAHGRYQPIPIDASDADLQRWFPQPSEIVVVDWFGPVAADLSQRLNGFGHHARFAIGGLRSWLARQPSLHDPALAVDWTEILDAGDDASQRLIDTNTRSNYWESGSYYGSENIPDIALILVPELLTGETRPIRLFSYWQPLAGSDVPPGDRLEYHATWAEAEAAARVLAKRGLNARYVSGGYVELYRRGYTNVPAYPNYNRTLDADEFHDLVIAARDVVYFDFRLPGIAEADRNPVPGRLIYHSDTINAAARDKWFDQLPKDRRYVGLGYDQRSYFQALRTGYELSRRGYVWLGVVGTPDLYSYVVSRDAWAESPDDFKGRIWQLLTTGHSAGLRRQWFEQKTIFAAHLHLMLLQAPIPAWLCLLLAGVAARLLVMPITGRPGRALPLMRLLILLGWIIGLCLAFAALARDERLLQNLPGPFGGGLLWADGNHLLPLLAGAIAAAQMIAAGWRSWRGLIGAALIGGVTAWLLWPVMQGMILLLIGLGLGALLPGYFRRSAVSDVRPGTGIDPLFLADRLADMPTKAHMQARLKRLGFRVPPGVVITPPLLDPILQDEPYCLSRLTAAIRPLGKALFARSAGFGEDDDRALTGRFISVPATPETLPAALKQVAKSFAAAGLPPGIIVQKRLDAEWSGVALSRAPLDPLVMLVEGGRARAITDGEAPAFSLRLSRATARPLDPLGDAPAALVRALGKALKKCETATKAPVTLEWLWAQGRLWLVQLRLGADISEAPPLLAERARLLDHPAVLDTRPFADLLPDPDPLTLDLYGAVYGASARPCFGRLAMVVSKRNSRSRPPRIKSVIAAVRRDLPGITDAQAIAAATDFSALTPNRLLAWIAEQRAILTDRLWPLVIMADRLARANPDCILPDLTYPGSGSSGLLAQLPAAEIARVFGYRGGAEAQLNARRFGTGRQLPYEIAPELFTDKTPITAERLKDDLHDRLAHQIALLADGIAALGRAYGIGSLIFACHLNELAAPPALEILTRRLADQAVLQAETPDMPLDTAKLAAGLPQTPVSETQISGTVVSRFDAAITAEILRLAPGQAPPARLNGRPILVARSGDTALIPVLRDAAALICETGGQLSHIAIVARQLGVPALMPARLPAGLKTGDRLTIMPDGTLISAADGNQ